MVVAKTLSKVQRKGSGDDSGIMHKNMHVFCKVPHKKLLIKQVVMLDLQNTVL